MFGWMELVDGWMELVDGWMELVDGWMELVDAHCDLTLTKHAEVHWQTSRFQDFPKMPRLQVRMERGHHHSGGQLRKGFEIVRQ